MRVCFIGFVALVDDDKKLEQLIEGCRKNNRACQHELYKMMYKYGMSICLRYTGNRLEAQEVLNDGFLKIFTKIDSYARNISFKGWARRIWINTAIDHFRRNAPRYDILDLSYAREEYAIDGIIETLSAEEIMKAVQQLPPAYRLIFNLYAIEGYSHPDIAEMLSISVGTSKSNLAKARMKLKGAVAAMNNDWLRNHG